MTDLYIYNTLTRKKEKFTPLKPPTVGMYTCGPTVYYYPQIGNWRTFVFEDVLRRVLEFNGYKVTHVMNVTDVGHLTGDNVGDADLGEDRMEKAAKKEGKTAWDVAEFYIKDFVESREKLNILAPHHFVRATDTISDQIELIKQLEAKDLIYKTELGVYFNVSKFPDYGKLGGQKLIDKRSVTREELKEDPHKKHPFDFALWKFSTPEDKRQMEWDSPWGRGFPGWHIECSAMSMKYLGESFDIHTGGVDHIAIHHTNEIAQSEGATGKLFAKYWLHGEFLKVDGGRMGKSLGNAYTLHDVEDKDFEPLALRYLYLTTHYRDSLNFTWEALSAAQTTVSKLRELAGTLKSTTGRTMLSAEKENKVEEFFQKFKDALNDDLNSSQALAVLWSMLKSNIPSEDKYDLLINFDEVLGLGIKDINKQEKKMQVLPESQLKLFVTGPISDEILHKVDLRELARKKGDYTKADEMRKEIEKEGYLLKDSKEGTELTSLK